MSIPRPVNYPLLRFNLSLVTLSRYVFFPSAWTLSQETEELNDQTWQDIEQALNELRD